MSERPAFPAQLLCDACGWTEGVADLFANVDAKCPECGGTINEGDGLALLLTLRDLADAGLVLPVKQDDPPTVFKAVFNTAPLASKP